MKKRLLLLPFLAALNWGACYAPDTNNYHCTLNQTERDIRLALCGFAMSAMILVIGTTYKKGSCYL